MAAEKTKDRKKINPEIFWLVAIFVLALVMRILAALTRDMVLFDEASFLKMAENLLEGRAPYDITRTTTTHFSFLYPFVTAALSVITRNTVAAGYAASILFSSLIVLPTYLFGKVMWNIRVGRAAAALVAVLPVMVDKGSLIDGQSLFAFWLMCAMFFGYRMQFTKRCMCGMLSGTCLGIAYLEDPSALYYPFLLFGLLVIIGYRQELSSYATKAAIQFMLMFLVFAIANIAYMTWQNGSFTVSDRQTDEIYAAVHDLPDGSMAREQEFYGLTAEGELRLNGIEDGKGIFASFAESPGSFIEAVAHRDYSVFFRDIHSLVPVWLLTLIGLGLFKFAWTRREALKYGFFALMMAPLLVLPIVWGDERFVLPYLGIVMLAVGRGWVYLEEWSYQTMEDVAGWKGGEKNYKPLVQGVVAAIVLAPLAIMALWGAARVDYPIELKQAGQWLAVNGGEGQKVMSREPSSAWYSGGTQLILPYASVEETLDYAERNDAAFLVISRQMTDRLRPQLEPLMETDNAYRSSLEPVYHSGEGTDEELIVYRFRQ